MLTPFTPCQTIDEVIARLDHMIERCIVEHSKLGYFAALYRNVTVGVRDGIAAGRFEDGPRMERFDVAFANRYFEAFDRAWREEETSQSWNVAFRAAGQWPPVILQHLLLGMSALINLDLAIAAVLIAPGEQLPGLKNDFFEITVLLAELIDRVQERIDRVSPWFRLIDRLGGRSDERLCAFAIGEVREFAWKTAQELAALPKAEFDALVDERDQDVARIGDAIRSPGLLLGMGLWLIRARETHPIPIVIETLRL